MSYTRTPEETEDLRVRPRQELERVCPHPDTCFGLLGGEKIAQGSCGPCGRALREQGLS